MEESNKQPKRYYWLRLKNTYFSQLEQKKMKRCEHGKDMQLIYLRMLLLSLDKEGFIYYQGVYESLEEELAEEFDEPVEVVKETLDFLVKNNMVSIDENADCYLPEAVEYTGSECYSAERVRRHRKNAKMLHCNDNVTNCNTHVTACNEENREREKRIKKEIENREEKIDYQQIADLYNDTCVSFPRLTKLSDSRKKAIKARMKTYSMEDFKKLFQMAEASSFLKGENARNWSATFDWLIKDSNMAKVLDGNYQDRQQVETAPDTEHNSYYDIMEEYANLPKSPDDPWQ